MADQDAISGILAGQQFQLNKFLIQEAPVKLEQEKLALKIATTDYDRRQKMAELLAQHADKVPPGQDPLVNAANSLVDMGNAAAQSGLVEEATTDFAKASTIMTQREDAAYKQFQMRAGEAKYANQLLATATDQQSFDAMNAHIEMTTGKPSALKGMKYTPELVAQLRDATTKHLTKAEEDLKKAQEDKAKAETEAAKVLPELRRSQIDLNKARTDAARKVGGDGLIAQPKNISAVTDALIKDSGDTLSSADARTFARDIALDVEERMKRDHQTQAQAVAAAVKFAKEHGVLAGLPQAHVSIGSSPKKPLPLPKQVEGYKDQKWYQAPDGPRWYDAETQSLYKAGEGPGDEEEEEP